MSSRNTLEVTARHRAGSARDRSFSVRAAVGTLQSFPSRFLRDRREMWKSAPDAWRIRTLACEHAIG